MTSLKLAFELPAVTTTTASPPTTTTAPPPTTTTTSAPPPKTTKTVVAPSPAPVTASASDSATGIATWYSEAPPGKCASPWLPFGTTITITDISTGVSISCVVDDREADNPGRVVDLSPSGFEAMAPLSQGVIQVNISW